MNFNNKHESTPFRDFFIGNKLCFYETLDSTNNEAKRNSAMPDGTVFVAKQQTNGRGRLGRQWLSDDTGLWMSILLKPDIKPEQVSQITLVMGLAVCRAIPGSKIKWPNDIVLDGKKVSGILTEMSAENDGQSIVVAGIGINVNTKQFPDSIKDIATSLYLQKGEATDKEQLLSKICSLTEKYYCKFLKKGFSSLVNEYRKNCITLKNEVLIKSNTGDYKAYALDINSDGELIVETKDGVQNVISGEVSVRGIFGYA